MMGRGCYRVHTNIEWEGKIRANENKVKGSVLGKSRVPRPDPLLVLWKRP